MQSTIILIKLVLILDLLIAIVYSRLFLNRYIRSSIVSSIVAYLRYYSFKLVKLTIIQFYRYIQQVISILDISQDIVIKLITLVVIRLRLIFIISIVVSYKVSIQSIYYIIRVYTYSRCVSSIFIESKSYSTLKVFIETITIAKEVLKVNIIVFKGYYQLVSSIRRRQVRSYYLLQRQQSNRGL